MLTEEVIRCSYGIDEAHSEGIFCEEIVALLQVCPCAFRITYLLLAFLKHAVEDDSDSLFHYGLCPVDIFLLEGLQRVKSHLVLAMMNVLKSNVPVLYEIFVVIWCEA